MPSNGSPNLSEMARQITRPIPEPLPDPQMVMGSWLACETLQVLFARRMTDKQKQILREEFTALRQTIDALAKPILKKTGEIPPHLIGAMGATGDALRLLRQSGDRS